MRNAFISKVISAILCAFEKTVIAELANVTHKIH